MQLQAVPANNYILKLMLFIKNTWYLLMQLQYTAKCTVKYRITKQTMSNNVTNTNIILTHTADKTLSVAPSSKLTVHKFPPFQKL